MSDMEPSEAQIEVASRVIREETSMPYMARVGDYLAEDAQGQERDDGLAALKAADEDADRMNWLFVRRVLKAAMDADDTPSAPLTLT